MPPAQHTTGAGLFADPVDARRLAVIAAAEAALLALAASGGGTLVTGALGWASGAASWTLVEYLLHRFAFHLPEAHALAVLGARLHRAHHAQPDRTPIVKPPAVTLTAFGAAFVGAAAALGPARVAPVWAGLVAGYLVYELCHLAAHRLSGVVHPWPAQRRRHLEHHRDPRALFGISSPIWDRILGSEREPES